MEQILAGTQFRADKKQRQRILGEKRLQSGKKKNDAHHVIPSNRGATRGKVGFYQQF